MNIIPGRKVGNFILNSPLQLYNNSHLIFSSKYLALIFDDYILLKYNSNQVLTEIQVFKLGHTEFTIYNCTLSSPKIIPTFDHVYRIMVLLSLIIFRDQLSRELSKGIIIYYSTLVLHFALQYLMNL